MSLQKRKRISDDDVGCRQQQRRRRCHDNDQHPQSHQPAYSRPVVVMREPRLELCHPDDFHALRDAGDVLPAAASTTVTDFTTLPVQVVYPPPPRHRRTTHNDDYVGDLQLCASLAPFACSCAVSCCQDATRDDLTIVQNDDGVIPLPVHYVAAQDDDDDDDDSVYGDTSRHHLSSKSSLFIALSLCLSRGYTNRFPGPRCCPSFSDAEVNSHNGVRGKRSRGVSLGKIFF